MLPKNQVSIGNVSTGILIIEELTRKKFGAVEVVVDKIVEQTGKLTEHDDIGAVGANSVAEEVTCSSIDEVLDISIEDTCSWEVTVMIELLMWLLCSQSHLQKLSP